jgi:hypothetical protein
MISRSQMNRQLYQMGGEGMQAGMQEGIMQMAPQEMQSQMQPMQDQSMQPQMQSMQAPLQNQEQPQLDPNQAIEILVRMLMEQGIPQEEAIKIAMQMIQAVSEGGMQEVSDDTRIEARFGGRIGYADGGISRLVDREQYGLGSFFKGVTKAVTGAVKGVTKAVKKVASSDLGKIALMAAAIYAGGGGFGISPEGFSVMGSAGSPGLLGSGTFSLGESVLGQQLLGTQVVDGIGKEGFLAKMGLGRGYGANPLSGISSLIPGKGSLLSAGAGFLGGALLGGMQPPQQKLGESLEDYERRVAEFQRQYQSNLAGTTGPSLPAGANNPFYPVYAARGGRIGYQEGSGPLRPMSPTLNRDSQGRLVNSITGQPITTLLPLNRESMSEPNLIKQVTQQSFFNTNEDEENTRYRLPASARNPFYGAMMDEQYTRSRLPTSARNPFYGISEEEGTGGRIGIPLPFDRSGPTKSLMANGGRMRYAMGNSVQQGIMAAPQIANQIGMPVGSPRMNEGGVPELDYRDEGGFVPPIGIKERADDIPAMLSNNEFVFTADAVKNADPEGEQDPERGAREMYVLMKRLENGGMV